MVWKKATIGLAVVWTSALLFSGCQTTDPAAVHEDALVTRNAPPESPPYFAPVYYPLRVGNTWHYVASSWLLIYPFGEPPPPPPAPEELNWQSQIVGFEERFGRRYVLEEGVAEVEGDSLFTWIRHRQDQKGLYEADVSIVDPPNASRARGSDPPTLRFTPSELALEQSVDALTPDRRRVARMALDDLRNDGIFDQVLGRRSSAGAKRGPGGVLDDEIIRLQYPLRPGAEWLIRPNPTFRSVVEGVETLYLPAGRFRTFRIRIEGFNPNVSSYLWVSRCGIVQSWAHRELFAMDPLTGEIFVVVLDVTTRLVGVDIDVPGHCDRGP